MKNVLKNGLIVVVIIGLFLFAYQSDIERKRSIILKQMVYQEYSVYRDSVKKVIKAYQDTINTLKKETLAISKK